MSRSERWNVELSEREEVIEVKEILQDLPADSSHPPSYPEMKIIDQNGRTQYFTCTEEERERILNGANIVLTIKEVVSTAKVAL